MKGIGSGYYENINDIEGSKIDPNNIITIAVGVIILLIAALFGELTIGQEVIQESSNEVINMVLSSTKSFKQIVSQMGLIIGVAFITKGIIGIFYKIKS